MHIETRLTDEVEIGARRRDTDNEDLEVITTDGGHEARNVRTAQSLLEFDLTFPTSMRDHSRYLEVRDCYKATRGGLHSFDFKDWADNTAVDEPLGNGIADGESLIFPLSKLYGFGNVGHLRRIQRPINPIVIKSNGIVLSGDFTVDYDLGLVLFDEHPAQGALLTWSGDFNVAVRFASALETSAPAGHLEHIEGVLLREVRLKAADFPA